MSPLYNELREILAAHYEPREAQAIALLVLEMEFGVSRTEVYADKVRHFSEEELCRWRNISQRLREGEPVQYVLGRADFCGLSFCVTPATLIPRPETETLVKVAENLVHVISSEHPLRLLDAGTGSGCIAVCLAKRLTQANVEAWDISEEALAVARQNALMNGVEVSFVLKDMLSTTDAAKMFDLIVSNPPYIMEQEMAEMAAHVLDFEPHTALFVPDDDALRFYRALASLAFRILSHGGYLCVEINAALGKETAELFRKMGLTEVKIIEDDFGRERIITARRP